MKTSFVICTDSWQIPDNYSMANKKTGRRKICTQFLYTKDIDINPQNSMDISKAGSSGK